MRWGIENADQKHYDWADEGDICEIQCTIDDHEDGHDAKYGCEHNVHQSIKKKSNINLGLLGATLITDWGLMGRDGY